MTLSTIGSFEILRRREMIEHGPEHERGRPRDSRDRVARDGGDDDRCREDEADREQRDGPHMIPNLADRRRRRCAEEQGGNEDGKRHVRIDRQLPDDRRERGRDAAHDHDDGHGQPHLSRQRREERRREKQPQEGLEPLHAVTLSEGRSGRTSVESRRDAVHGRARLRRQVRSLTIGPGSSHPRRDRDDHPENVSERTS
jgi:hypothetical protein